MICILSSAHWQQVSTLLLPYRAHCACYNSMEWLRYKRLHHHHHLSQDKWCCWVENIHFRMLRVWGAQHGQMRPLWTRSSTVTWQTWREQRHSCEPLAWMSEGSDRGRRRSGEGTRLRINGLWGQTANSLPPPPHPLQSQGGGSESSLSVSWKPGVPYAPIEAGKRCLGKIPPALGIN